MKKYKYIFISLLIIILDQLSKYLINNNFILNKESPLINNLFSVKIKQLIYGLIA